MDPRWYPLVLVVFAAWQLLTWRQAVRREAAVLREAGARLPLREAAVKEGFTASLTGAWSGLRVEVVGGYRTGAGKRSQTRVMRYTVRGLPTGYSLGRQGVGHEMLHALTGDDVQIGDPGFDHAFLLEGEPRLLHAALDSGTRQLAWELLQASELFQLRGGVLVIEVQGEARSAGTVAAFVERVLSLAGGLAVAPADAPHRLARILQEDPMSSVRLVVAKVLATKFSGRVAEEALRGALDDRSPEVRAVAAGRLASWGELAAVTWDPEASPATRAEALRKVASTSSRDLLVRRYEELLRSEFPEVRGAALEALPVVDPTGAADRLLTIRPTSPAEKIALARGLGRLDVGVGERRLLLLLDDSAAEVAAAAAQALGAVGTLAAVPALVARSGGGRLGSGPVAAVAREAVGRIRGRAGNVEAGRIALVEGSAGAIALAPGEAGLVAVARPVPRDGE